MFRGDDWVRSGSFGRIYKVTMLENGFVLLVAEDGSSNVYIDQELLPIVYERI